MFCESYKDTHPDKYIEYDAVTNGYKIKWNTDTEYATDLELLEDYNHIYVRSDGDINTAFGMWIASPSADNIVSLIATNNNSITSVYGYSSNHGNLWGLRPIVCLDSNVILEKGSGDNNYTIK